MQPSSPSTTVTTTDFGPLPDGTATQLFHLTSPDVRLTIATLGARVVSLSTRDREGRWGDVALGYNDAKTYVTTTNTFFGATIGRFANRIAGGKFTLDGHAFQVPINNGPNALHGGPHSFDLRPWMATATGSGVAFELTSPADDNGFPGTLKVRAAYTLEGARVRLQYSAQTDAPTVVNLTNHTYFNLAGEGSATVLDHDLQLFAEEFTPINEALIPTGERTPVRGTPFDFRQSAALGERIGEASEQLLYAGGYDHNFVVKGTPNVLRPAAVLYAPLTGRKLQVDTTQPGVQVYSGNFLDGTLIGKSGRPYLYRSALCLETQHFPDSPNQPAFPSTVLRPGETFLSETVWTFGTEG